MRKKISAMLAVMALAVLMVGTTVFAAEVEEGSSISSISELEAGEYTLDSYVTAYLPAMGGCDFGSAVDKDGNVTNNIIETATLTVLEDGTASITLKFKTYLDVTMQYGALQSYVSAEGETSYYDGSAYVEAEYTTAEGSYVDSDGKETAITYVAEMTFPITEITDTYSLGLNFAGTQFGGSTAYTTSSGHTCEAIYNVNWSSILSDDVSEEITTEAQKEDAMSSVTEDTASEESGSGIPWGVVLCVVVLVVGIVAIIVKKRK